MRAFDLSDKGVYTQTKDWKAADWIHVENPSNEDVEDMVALFGIPKDYILDSLDEYEIPRQEKVQNGAGEDINLLIVLFPKMRSVQEKYTEYHTYPLSIIRVNDTLITVCKETPSFLTHIMNNESFKNEPATTQHHIILYILWELTRSFIRHLREIDGIIEDLQIQIISATHNEYFYKLIALHKSLVYFETSINKNHPLITESIHEAVLGDDVQSQELLRDITDISNQAEVMVTESSKMIDQLSEVFSSVITNNLNNIMKVLTSITIVLTIPTIMAGFWGMNVDLPFENHPWAFGITSLITIVICFLTVYWLKKKDYF
ncbi:magnesium transporter CorA family protein [Trichococcus shcherbakoviae]|uniref:magnesium transporter CorA family protein n=1 Tax=Trichococcus shcherbakoviae TaxID=2094020 RepID=UPI0029F4BF13|nr:magnesium transporter CorA family protein [Trichococcus shcherbakoviae]